MNLQSRYIKVVLYEGVINKQQLSGGQYSLLHLLNFGFIF